MRYANWNIRNVKHQIRYLQHNNQNGKYNIDIEILKQIIDNSIIPFEHEFTLKEKLLYDKEKLNEYNYFLNDIKNFTSYNIGDHDYSLNVINIPISELLIFVNDFFKEVFPSWYNIFNKVYREKHNNLKVGGREMLRIIYSRIRLLLYKPK